MRVIYKHNGANSYIPPAQTSGANRKESVLVISAEKKSSNKEDSAISIKGDDFDVKISKEALQLNGEVHQHEKAHMAVLGSAAKSGIIYNNMRGPGGESIAVGGKIAVDLSAVPGDPQATLSKARTVISAAFAAANPSGGDMRTAAKAYSMAKQAQEQINADRIEGKLDIMA